MNKYNFPPGTLIATNSNIPENNGHFGCRWNHIAVIVSDSLLVHSLEKVGVVVDYIDSLIYHPETGEYTFLIPKDRQLGERAANEVYSLAGTGYNLYSTLTRWSARRKWNGLSCVGAARYGWQKAVGHNLNWRFPDDVLTSNLFQQTEVYSNVR